MFPFSGPERPATPLRGSSRSGTGRRPFTVRGRLHLRRTRVVDQPGVASPVALPIKGQQTRTDADERTAEQTLCAATYIYPRLADYVVHIFLGLLPAAWAPSVAVDPVALLRHAIAARRRHRWRDAVLLAQTLGTVGTPVVVLAVRSGPVPAATLTALLVVTWAGRAHLGTLLRAGWADAWSRDRERRRRGTTRLAWALAVVACAVLLAWYLRILGPGLAAAAVGVGLSWVVVVVELLGAQHRARAVLTGGAEPRDLAPPLAPELEERLDRLAEMNVVVYDATRADAPFVGSGYQVDPWSVVVDVHRGAKDDSGKEQPPRDVCVAELHTFLADQFSVETAIEASASRQLSAGHRLYVDGSRISWHSALLTGRPPLPCQRLPASDLDRYLDQPEGTDHRRVYFQLQEVGQHGAIAVTLFVRAHRQGAALTIELVPHVLLPVLPDIEAAVGGLARHGLDRWLLAVGSGARAVLPAMVDSPACWAKRMWGWVWVRHLQFVWRRAAQRQRPYDFGSAISVREGVAMDDPKEVGYFVLADLIRIHTHLQARVLGSIKQFLDARSVNTEQFDPSSARSVHNAHTLNINTMQGGIVVNGQVSRLNQRQPGEGDSGEKKP